MAFQATVCIICSICSAACPEDAVHLGDAISLAAILTDEATPPVSGDLVLCAGCGALTARQADDSAPCSHVCRHSAGVVTTLRDDAGLMAVLLTRAAQRAQSTDD